MIFWLVLKLEISYNRVMISLKDFGFLLGRGFFLKIIFFLHGEIF
jgi:hypothetical protein